jgi:hypothetical protein
MERVTYRQQMTDKRPAATDDSLYEHGHGGRVHGPYPGRVLQSSAYTSAMLSDVTRALPFIAAGLAVAAGMRRWQRHDRAA